MPWGPVLAAVAGLAGAWVAAGSVGLLGHPLRHVLTLVALGVVALAAWPRGLKWGMALAGVGGFVLAAMMAVSPLPPVNVLAVALMLAVVARAWSGQGRGALLTASSGVAIFGLYYLARTSIPLVWSAADWAGGLVGHMGAWPSGRPLLVGSTFGGLDFLVLMAAILPGFLSFTAPPRRWRGLYAVVAILAGQLVYLAALACVPDLLASLPAAGGEERHAWADLLREGLPWNAPVLACVVQCLIAGIMLRWSLWSREEAAGATWLPGLGTRGGRTLAVCAVAIALIIPMLSTLCADRLGLEGRKIVVYEKGFLNWLKPEHGSYGRLSVGMYGMLPTYVESLGGECLISPELSADDLDGADALILLFPDEPWEEGQLDRIWRFVREGGSLLVLGEHTTHDKDGGGANRFNEVLEPTAMRVQFDSATFEIGGWLQSYEALPHPATVGMPDDRNEFGVVIGASLGARPPARPLLVGRWGWGDPGDESKGRSMMGNGVYDAGEKLGDLVLAAEQPLGKGKVIAFGDTSSMTNGITVGAHVFTSRLLAYLGGRAGTPQAFWRQALGILAVLVVVASLLVRRQEWHIGLVAGAAAASLVVCVQIGHRNGEVFPDGRRRAPNNLAYIDASHLGAYSGESWRTDGAGALSLTLMRNGYLTLMLPEFTAERLKGAGLVVSIAPSREFTAAERSALREFLERGGVFILTAGYDGPQGGRSLLAEYGLAVAAGVGDGGEPEPMGHFKSPFLRSGDQLAHVRFHAGWPVAAGDVEARVIAYGKDGELIIVSRAVGEGQFILIGDACFAMNKNLEWENGALVEGKRENADFWRWLITDLKGEAKWIPPLLRGESE